MIKIFETDVRGKLKIKIDLMSKEDAVKPKLTKAKTPTTSK